MNREFCRLGRKRSPRSPTLTVARVEHGWSRGPDPDTYWRVRTRESGSRPECVVCCGWSPCVKRLPMVQSEELCFLFWKTGADFCLSAAGCCALLDPRENARLEPTFGLVLEARWCTIRSVMWKYRDLCLLSGRAGTASCHPSVEFHERRLGLVWF